MRSTSFSLRALALGLVLVAVLVPAVGCVLVVPAIEHDAHCAISGTSECATCIRTSCQLSVDACCGDASCSGEEGHSAVLDALDACASGDKTGCARGLGDAQSATAGAVRTCVTSTCQDACLSGTAVEVKWTCATPRTEDNDCAACVYGKCAAALESCCGDSSCSKDSTIQKDISACVGGDAPGCVYMTTHGTSGTEGVVRACIQKQCNPSCFGDLRTHQSCDLRAGGSYCDCAEAEKSAGPDCSSAAVGGTCVVGFKGCTCGKYSCGATSGGCSCDFRSDGDNHGETGCSITTKSDGYGKCCVKVEDRGATCECDEFTRNCDGTNEYSTPTCDASDVMTVLENLIVPRCSN